MIGHELRTNIEVFYGLGVALLIVVLLTPAVGGMARLAAFERRSDGRRTSTRTVPRLGGLALFFGIFVPALAFLDLNRSMRGLLLGAAVATTVGAIDDLRGLRWWRSSAASSSRRRSPWGSGSGSIASASPASACTSCRRGSARR